MSEPGQPEAPPDPGAALPPTAAEVEAARRSREKHFEIVATVLLSLTALVTAWSGYQASLWDGIQSSDYTQASAARTEAAQLRTTANEFRLADLGIFENWVDATIDGDEPLATFYEERFRDEFAVAFDAWIALDPLQDPDAPGSPLAMPEYQLAADADADELESGADTLFSEGEDANSVSDTYTLATLLFAVVLFFAAISERFEFAPMRTVLLSMAALGLAVGLVISFSQPVTTG